MSLKEKTSKSEILCSFAPAVYSESERIANKTNMFSSNPITVRSESRYCTLVNAVAVQLLIRNDIPAKLSQHWSGVEDFVDHAHVSIGHNTLADYQYLQFVPEELRIGLPDCLVATFSSPTDLSEQLSSFQIPQSLHHYWTNV